MGIDIPNIFPIKWGAKKLLRVSQPNDRLGLIILTDFNFSEGRYMKFPMLVPTFQLGHMSNLVHISIAVMVEGPFEPHTWLDS